MYPLCPVCVYRRKSQMCVFPERCAGCRLVRTLDDTWSPSGYEQDPDAPRIVVTSRVEGGSPC